MIASLSGFIIYRDTGSCVVDVNGVGYLVATSSRTLATLPSPPEKTNLLNARDACAYATVVVSLFDDAALAAEARKILEAHPEEAR